VSSTNKTNLHDITEILTEEAASSVSVLYGSRSVRVKSVCALYWSLAFCKFSGRNHKIININVVIVSNQEYWRVMYICAKGIHFSSFYDFRFWSCSDIVVFCVFHFISQISLATDYTGSITFIIRYDHQI